MLEFFFKLVSLSGSEVRTLPPREGERATEWASRARRVLELRAIAASERLGDRVEYAMPEIDEKGDVRFEDLTLTAEGIVVKTRRATVLIRHEGDQEAAEALRAAVWAEGVADGRAAEWLKIALILHPERAQDFEACWSALDSPWEQIAKLLRKAITERDNLDA